MKRQKISPEYNLKIVNPSLAKEWHPTKNGKLTPKDITPKYAKKVWWRCKKGHEWETRVDHRSNGSGCPYCCGKKANKDNCLATVNHRLASEWHPTKNSKFTPKDVTPFSNKKVWWKCKKGHEYTSTVHHRSNGTGCPYCSGRKTCGDNCLAIVNPKLAKEWHPAKNGKLKPEDVVSGSHKKVWWLCRNGHEWEAIVKSRSKGRGCPYCSGNLITKETSLAFKNPQLAKEWHPTKNGNLTPLDVMPKSNKMAWWKCKRGHEYKSSPNNNSRGGGCPYCGRRKASADYSLATVNPKLAKEWHPTKNGKLGPEDVTPKSQKKVWWICKKGHEHFSSVSNKSRDGRNGGCPYCNSSTSMMELRLYAELKYIFPETKLREKINKVECDIYIPSLNVAVEYDGVYWHRNKCKKDHAKNSALEKKGIKLIRVREKGLDRIDENDIIYDYSKKKEKHLMDRLLKKIEHLSVLSDSDQKKAYLYLKGSKLANNKEFVNLLDMLPSPVPGNSFADKKPNLAQEWHPLKNGKLTPWDVALFSNKKVWWRCKKGHEWQSIVGNRSKGNGCPYCSGRIATKDNCLAHVNPKLASEWHPTKNGKLTPKDVTHKSNIKRWWQCKKGHEWEAVVSSRSNGSGCPYCSGNKKNEKNQYRFSF